MVLETDHYQLFFFECASKLNRSTSFSKSETGLNQKKLTVMQVHKWLGRERLRFMAVHAGTAYREVGATSRWLLLVFDNPW